MAYQINLYGGVSHGFAIRADISKPDIRFAQTQAFQQAVQWFQQHL
jgi:sterol O-acyltransferase